MDLDGTRLAYHVVDVFTHQPYAGNPLAVVLDADDLTGEQMQTLAAEFHLSETAFPLAPDAGERAAGADYRLRIFTPDLEIPFAGHPSIGTAWLLRRLGRVSGGTVRQQCGAGLLPLTMTDGGVTLTGGEPVLTEAIDPTPALAAVGLTAGDLAGPPPRNASTGLGYTVLPVKPDALPRCAPNLDLLRRDFSHPNFATGVYVVAWEGEPRQVAARMFAGDIGSVEDAATGSAALALGVYLGGIGLLGGGTSTFDIAQGVAMGRPSRLRVTCEVLSGVVTAARVTGSVVHVAAGTVLVP
jgi:trans-2,3-dihydro-3-hydroxyanthranilate isomerase